MNFLEKNRKKIAVLICLLTSCPIIATAFAMENEDVCCRYIDEKELVVNNNIVEGKIKKNSKTIKEVKLRHQESIKEAMDTTKDSQAAKLYNIADNVGQNIIKQENNDNINKTQKEEEREEKVNSPKESIIVPKINLDEKISKEAMKLVGITDGQWCTEVATQALVNAGFPATVLWPDQYVMYGNYIDISHAKPGNLIFYNNGGRGVDHIAIYIGNGMAVHGNYLGRTIIETIYIPNAGLPQFIQINY